MEVSAKRKKRNQFISVLIIVAIVLMGVIVWGWIELQKSRNAERIKNALNSQVEPGFKEPEGGLEPYTDSGNVTVQDTPPAVDPAKPVAEAPSPAKPAPVAAPAKPAPEPAKPAKPRKETVKAADLPKEPSAEPAPIAEVPAPAKPPAPKPAPVKPAEPVAAKPKPEPKAAPEPTVVSMHKPDPIPSAPAPKPAPAPATKVYPPEDLPLPEKPEPTEEAKSAVAAIPAPAAPANAAEGAGSSSNYKLGMSAYRQQDYVNAIRSFTAVPRPTSKKRGAQDRDEYVQANFLKGMSLLKVGHLSEAVSAFQNVLEYEKYYPLANMNLGICYVELKQYAKAHQAFEAVVRDQSFIEPAAFDDVMQRTKYFWALAWTRLYKNATNPDKQNFYRQQALLKWKDYEVWFSKNDKYKSENLKAENYLKSLSL
jgi:hypothetical protein